MSALIDHHHHPELTIPSTPPNLDISPLPIPYLSFLFSFSFCFILHLQPVLHFFGPVSFILSRSFELRSFHFNGILHSSYFDPWSLPNISLPISPLTACIIFTSYPGASSAFRFTIISLWIYLLVPSSTLRPQKLFVQSGAPELACTFFSLGMLT
jgi:hypothetical protein